MSNKSLYIKPRCHVCGGVVLVFLKLLCIFEYDRLCKRIINNSFAVIFKEGIFALVQQRNKNSRLDYYFLRLVKQLGAFLGGGRIFGGGYCFVKFAAAVSRVIAASSAYKGGKIGIRAVGIARNVGNYKIKASAC